MRSLLNNAVVLLCVPSILAACAPRASNEAEEIAMAATTAPKPGNKQNMISSVSYSVQNNVLRAQIRYSNSQVATLQGSTRADGTATLTNDAHSIAAEALCADPQSCKEMVLDIYAKAGAAVAKAQFATPGLLGAPADDHGDAPMTTAEEYVGTPLSEEGSKILNVPVKTDVDERALAPWLNLTDGGQAVGPTGTTAANGQTIHGGLINAGTLPANLPFIKRANPERGMFGTGMMISLLQNGAQEMQKAVPTNAVYVNAIATQNGGPFRPHASHENGQDADVLYMGQTQYGTVLDSSNQVTAKFNPEKNMQFLRLLFSQRVMDRGQAMPAVLWVFMAPEIKTFLCNWAKQNNRLQDPLDADILRRIHPTEGHDTHFHVRLRCSPHYPLCRREGEPAPGTGC